MSDNVRVTNENELPKPSKAEVIAKIKAMQAELKRIEATTGPSGAMSNAPMAQILAADGVQSKDVDHRYRWVSVSKAARRQMEGYVKVTEAEFGGSAQRGNLLLMKLPRPVYEARLEAIRKINRERLTAHNREVEEVAEGIAKYLRDERGMSVRTEDILYRPTTLG